MSLRDFINEGVKLEADDQPDLKRITKAQLPKINFNNLYYAEDGYKMDKILLPIAISTIKNNIKYATDKNTRFFWNGKNILRVERDAGKSFYGGQMGWEAEDYWIEK